MKVIIAGGRDFNDYDYLREKCDYYLQNMIDVEIVSGKAKGADSLGERYGTEKGFKIKEFPADWDKYGKSAGYRRNGDMADYADSLIAFWDGESKGTNHMINLARDKGLKVRICLYKKGV